MKKTFAYALAVFLIPFFAFPQSLFAVGSGGYENASFSTRSLAQWNAVVAQADEPAAISYNPAGITELPGLQVQSNINFISAFTYYRGPRAGDQRSAGTIVTVPTGYITLNPGKLLDDRIAFGIGSDSPFGLSNKWNSFHPTVHYTGWNNYFKMYTIKPTVAVKVADWLSVGGGPMYYRIYDWGGIQAYPNVLRGGGADGQVRLNLSGNHWGWQMGVLAKPHQKHQFGFYFRSPVVVPTKGPIKVENSSFGGRFETGGNAKITLPLNFTWAYAFKPTDKTTVETDFGYTRWSTYKRLFINNDPVNANDDAILAAIGLADKDYDDSFSVHLGGNHKLTQNLTLLAGGAFYTNAVPADHYIPAIPDSNSLGFALGVDYKFLKHYVLGVSYLNRFWLRRNIESGVSESIPPAGSTTVDGRYRTYLQEFTISFTYKWDDIFDKIFSKSPATSPDIQSTAATA